MKTKKILSLVLAMVMALSLAVPAFASTTSNETSLAQSSTITGETQVPTIKITVPATGSVVVNPYKMSVDIDDQGTTSTDQIISATQYVSNASDLAMKVSATVSGKVAGQAKLVAASTATATDGAANNVYMNFESVIADNDTSAANWSDASKKTINVTTTKGTATDLGTLAKGTGTAAASTGAYLAYHLTGDAVSSPAKAWTNKDTVTVTVAFTFTPVADSGAVTPPAPTTYAISEGSHADASGDISAVAFKVSGSAATVAAENDTVTIEVTATTGKTITASVNGGASVSVTESGSTGNYTGTFTMPAQAATVVLTVA